ncbi:MAG TPA: cupredoxin family copper-binding protein [Acidimicrobiales bacterium]|nr:cupredoxin family copper-binding protein [Acidimicrobiales bacterium]
MIRRRQSAVAAALAIVLVSAGALVLRSGGASDRIPLAGAATAPVRPVDLASYCPTRTAAEPVVLDIAGFAYCPATFTVAAGAEVAWTNADLAPHTVTYDGPGGPVDSGSMVQGQTWSTRFDQPGTYRYYCRFHPGMTGTILVDSGG